MMWDATTTMDSRHPERVIYRRCRPIEGRFTIYRLTEISRITVIAIIMVLALVSLSWAADDNSSDEEPTVLEEVIVEGEAPSVEQPQQDVSAFGQVLEIAELAGIPVSLSEALETATGLGVNDFGGLGKLSTVTLRGLSSNDVLILLDGIPLNSAALGGVDLSDIPLASVERIEIIRGPEAALYGNNAAGGIINIISVKGRGGAARYSIRAGSFGYASGDLSIAESRDNLDFIGRIYGSTYRGEFPYLDNNGTSLDSSDDFTAKRLNNEYDDWGFFTGVSTNSGEWNHSLDIDTNFSRKGIPGLTTFPTPDADQSDKRYLVHYGVSDDSLKGGDGELGFELGLLHASRGYSDPSGSATGQPVFSHWNETRYIGAARYSEFIGATHYLITGVEFGQDIFNPSDSASHERSSVGVYLRDEIAIGDSTVIPAIRYDSIEEVGSRISPKLGWRCELNDTTTVKANLATAFRAPTFEELYRREGFVVGNPELNPENTIMADGGFIYDSGRVRLEADYFRGRANDLIEYVLGSGFRYRPLNFGKARLSGYEMSIRYQFDDAWRFEANATHTSATDISDNGGATYGRQIPGRPKWDAFGGLNYSDPSGDWGGHIQAYFSGGRYLTAANTRELDDDLSFNIGFDFALDDSYQFAFEVKNILDEDLMDVRGFPLPGRTFIISFTKEA